MSLAERLASMDKDLTRWAGRRDAVLAQIRHDEGKFEEFTSSMDLLAKATEVLQGATEARRAELQDRVENLVTRGLRAAFRRQDVEFVLKVQLQRNVFGVVPVLRTGFGEEVVETSITEGHGGGYADLVGFLLRVVVLALARPKVAPLLVLDESFAHVSPEYLRGVAALIRELNESAGIQFVIVTHKDELIDAADVVYRTKLVKGRTQFTLEHDLRDGSFHGVRKPEGKKRGGNLWDHEDLVSNVNDAVETISETQDVLARKQRHRAAQPKPKKKAKKKRRG